MKLSSLNLQNNIQKPVQPTARNNVSNAIENQTMTAPTQTDSQRVESNVSSAASNPIEKKPVETLKAQMLAQAPISYTFIRDIKLPFSNNAKLYKLANGQKVAILEKKGPTVLETYYNVGSMNEPDNKRGISHFEEHMAFNGSKNPNGGGLAAGDFFRIVNQMGAITNASTGFSQTNYFITSQLLSKHDDFDSSVYIQSEQLQYPSHSENMLIKEKGPVTQEIAMVGDQPENMALNQCIKNLFNIESSSPDLIAGTISNINNLTRQDIVDYYNLWYTPDNSVTVVTGEVPEKEAINTIAKYFNKVISVPAQNRKYQEFNPIQKAVRVDIKMPKAQSSISALGFAGPANNSTKENIELEVLMTALFGYKNARIRKALNLIQSSASINIERIGNRPADPKAILIASKSTPQKTEEVLNTLYKEINRLFVQPITQEELDTAKKNLKMTFSKISESSQMINSLLGNALLDDNPDYVENYLKILDKITTEDISNFAKKYFDLNKVSLAVVHPQKIDDDAIINNYKNANKLSVNTIDKVSSSAVTFKGKLEDKMLDTSKIKQYRLANNLELILNPNNSDISNSYIKMQTIKPAKTKPGVPSILSVILNEGSKNKTHDEFYKDVYKSGISLTFSAGYNFINADFDSLSEDLGKSLDLVKEVFNEPRINQKSFEYAKSLVREISMKIDKSANEAASKELFPELTEFSTTDEVLKSLDNITIEDVQEFFDYIKNNSMAKAVVTAPIHKNTSLENTVISKLSTDSVIFKPFSTELFNTYRPIEKNKLITQAEPRNQADIVQVFNFKTNFNPKDQMVFSLLNTILGGSPSSRLFEDLRETQKLAYRVESGLDFVGDTGLIFLSIKTTTDNPQENIQQFDNVKKSLDGFKKHIDKMKSELVSQDELDAAKLRLKTKFLNLLETSDSVTGVLASGKDLVYGINSINENLKIIDEITPQDIQNAANYIFNSNSITSILASQKTLDNMKVSV